MVLNLYVRSASYTEKYYFSLITMGVSTVEFLLWSAAIIEHHVFGDHPFRYIVVGYSISPGPHT